MKIDNEKLCVFDYDLIDVLKTLDEYNRREHINKVSEDMNLRLRPFLLMFLRNKLYYKMNDELSDYDVAKLIITEKEYNKYGLLVPEPKYEYYYDLKDMRNIVNIDHAKLLEFEIPKQELEL